MNVKITLEFATPEEARDALLRLTSIAHEDRPDVGAEPAVVAPLPTPEPVVSAALVFGGAVAAVHPAPAPAAVALPAPAAPPPPPTPALPPPAVQGPEFDKTGLPWDARIHASTKTKNKDGTWRSKRDLDPEFQAKIEAELRGAPAPAPAAPPSPPAAPIGIAAPAVPPAPGPAVPAVPAVPAAAEGFAQFIARTSQMAARDAARYNALMGQALGTAGLTTIGQLAAQPPETLASVISVYDALAAQG